jgi:hypothetical protein
MGLSQAEQGVIEQVSRGKSRALLLNANVASESVGDKLLSTIHL